MLFVNTDIDKLNGNVSVPKINIVDFSINGENKIYKIKDNIAKISYDSKNIKIRVTTNDGDILRHKLYKYNVNGSVYESFKPELFITSLPPGNYPIKISTGLKDSSYKKEQLLFTLVVMPPWYNTWWFFLICTIITIIVISGIILFVIKNKENKMKWIMKEYEQKIYEKKIQFLINISHELRTPLTLAHAPLNRILKSIDKNEKLYKPLLGIYNQTNRMKEIINMVLDIRRIETGHNKLDLKLNNFNEWLDDVCNNFKEECCANNIELKINNNDVIDDFYFDKNKCTIILTNLLSNALKHSPQNTCINVSCSIENKNRMKIIVSDEGKGLKGIDTNKLFERFYQGENETVGSGIGLSYSKNLVEIHNGNIGAYQNKLCGASFFFEIPINLKPQNNTEYRQEEFINKIIEEGSSIDCTLSKQQIKEQNNIKILFVDDNVSMTKFMAEELTFYYQEILTANSGSEALDIINSIHPDIIISDVMMPGMNGYELCKNIKQNLSISHIPIILLTARNDERSKEYGYKVGADAYIAKPFSTEELSCIINNLIYNRKKVKDHYRSYGIIPEPVENTFSLANEVFMEKLNKIILDNIENNSLNVNFICKEIGMSKTSLYTKIKAITDIGASEYISKLKMEKAIQLIISGKYPVNEIAIMTGFNTHRYFCTVFKQYTGMSPTEFRKKHMIAR